MMTNPTKEQKDMIQNTEGYIRCGAVPGSGKTYCITKRMAYLITDLYVDPASIVALTFTNKAASSMTRRLKKMTGDDGVCFTGTFHGYCNKILKEEIYRLSYPKAFAILDKKDQTNLIREVAGEQNLSLKNFTAKDYLEDISRRKTDTAYIKYMAGSDKSLLQGEISSARNHFECVYYNYLMKQRDNYALDFNDMIDFTVYILGNYQDALQKWQDRCQYILCDEYQDVNKKQELLLQLLSGKYRNLTVVGDDDQCIYGWRGSKVDYIVDFQDRYEGAKDFYLSENFRSTPEIVAAANSLIKANRYRIAKEMFTNNPSGSRPVYNHLKSEKEEAFFIADRICQAAGGGKTYSDHAVLVRASSQTRALEEAFVKKKVPYKVLNGAQFYGSEEIKTVLSYLRMVYALSDMDFVWTIKRPRRGFGKKALDALRSDAARKGISLMEALGQQIKSGAQGRVEVVRYYNEMIELHEKYQEYSCKDLIHMALDLGYRKELEQDVDQTRLDNVSELIGVVAALEEENQEKIPLDELLSHFALFSMQDDDTDKDVVKVMTVHTAKGLEFDTVFVNGLVEGQFPSKRLQNGEEMEEERRLLYVAITRAKNRLYLTSYGEKNDAYPVRPSGFLSDMDAELFDCIGDSKMGTGYEGASMRPKAQFRAGERVVHKVFGGGTVIAVDERGQTYEIDFESLVGTRRIQFRAELEKEGEPKD